ncbi:bifunctional 4-hydroxy-2-oxoglutarate aldolase/2-dehydro-3-deoxy-phosphogluconate aldolase [Halalkalibacillus halophilus]|uniref:bifunctional 4-hydroxy-2-oxoglutarate aldolase/2-dehydro-3-deoxy-phosphogluconate aldolase n=1 Tax=Halalkalibacillus halophilus TaxID=392827 RepID=UPI00041A2A66|nr:bifunctional 4-hydroxy-2-oxoglutarate aldolase/2-dehydro-3-deoxy-phosphogluconate aldolase [Halalkalibacillus halophilus]
MSEFFGKHPIVAVVRHADDQNIVPIGEALLAGGIDSIEVTAETPDADLLIEKLDKELGDQLYIGAGTVLDPETAEKMVKAGADYIVSPTLNVETIKSTKRLGKLSIPGAFTPTEILEAYEAGADCVKVFPAGILGSDYIKNLKGPLPQIPVMVTGGVDLGNTMKYIKSGAVAVGIGSQLVNAKDLKREEDFRQLTNKATLFTNLFEG